MNISNKTLRKVVVPIKLHGKRLDKVSTELFLDYSRNQISKWIKKGNLHLNGSILPPRHIVSRGDILHLSIESEIQEEWIPQEIPLAIIYEDEAVLILNKPSDLVVHPGAGHPDGTLLNAILNYLPEAINVPRGGIVHRLDKKTTGIMVIAKTIKAYSELVTQLKNRRVSRIYDCVVLGNSTMQRGTINAPIGRHHHKRQQMAVVSGGKESITHYFLLERFRTHTYIRVKLETGRTHQIRVHMSYAGFPLLGDDLYGRRQRIPIKPSNYLSALIKSFPRQALHARFLSFEHPKTGLSMSWEAPVPEDLNNLLKNLQEDILN